MRELTEKNETIGAVHWSFWAIGVITLLYNVAGGLNFVMQLNADNVAAMPDMYRSFIAGRPVWATGGFAFAVFGGVIGCLLLLLKKSAAFYVFIAALLGAIVTMIHALSFAPSIVSPIVIGNSVQLLVTVFLIWYSTWGERKGWVR